MATRLTRTTVTPTNGKKYTISLWIKLGNIEGYKSMIACELDTGYLIFNSSKQIEWYDIRAGETTNWQIYKTTTAKYRDCSAWYHIVAAADTTLSGVDNISKLYVNGELITSFAVNSTVTNDTNTILNQGSITQNIGTLVDGTNYPVDSYLAHFHFIDGTQYAASDFASADSTSGIWKPNLAPSVTYGDNGFFI